MMSYSMHVNVLNNNGTLWQSLVLHSSDHDLDHVVGHVVQQDGEFIKKLPLSSEWLSSL